MGRWSCLRSLTASTPPQTVEVKLDPLDSTIELYGRPKYEEQQKEGKGFDADPGFLGSKSSTFQAQGNTSQPDLVPASDTVTFGNDTSVANFCACLVFLWGRR